MQNQAPGNQVTTPRNVIEAAVQVIDKIIIGKELKDAQSLVEQAEKIGNFLKQQNLSSSQIRNIFGTVRTIESTWRTPLTSNELSEAPEDDSSTPAKTGKRAPTEEEVKATRIALHNLFLLKPRMAYAASRSPAVSHVNIILSAAIDEVVKDNPGVEEAQRRFTNFLDFFEAILAYHRAAGGR